MKTQFSTEQYVRNHGRNPKGRGSWAFQLSSINGWSGEGEIHFTPSMTLVEAKKWIKPRIQNEAIRLFHGQVEEIEIEVLP